MLDDTSTSWPCTCALLEEPEAMDGAVLEASIEFLREGPLGSPCSHAPQPIEATTPPSIKACANHSIAVAEAAP